jgi:hypothetical protein
MVMVMCQVRPIIGSNILPRDPLVKLGIPRRIFPLMENYVCLAIACRVTWGEPWEFTETLDVLGRHVFKSTVYRTHANTC